VVLLGLGKQESVGAESIRRAYSCAVRIAQARKVECLYVALPQTSAMERRELLSAVGDGVFLTNYAFTRLKEETLKDNPVVLLKQAVFIGCGAEDELVLNKQLTIATGVHLVRELVNGNADEITPQFLAETAWSLEKRTEGLKATVLEKKHIQKEKMGLFLAVNRGSPLDPCLIQLAYRGNPKSKEHIVLIGKGVTYDTGGL
jgi:leucyl aminopeptidase